MPKYNREIFEDDDGSIWEKWTDRSGMNEHYSELFSGLDDDSDDVEEGCAACGNPAYPDCKDSCPLFD